MTQPNRRHVIRTGAGVVAASVTSHCLPQWPNDSRVSAAQQRPADRPGGKMRLGLVTYLWGKEWDLPTLLANCEKTMLEGLELRTEHAHGVEPSLSTNQRKEVRGRLADSPVELVGYGSNAQFHEEDPQKVRENIELTKSYIDLMHDCGGTGVKVKPNGFVQGVAHERTIEQIGGALAEVAEYGKHKGQEIRVEVHGQGTQQLPNMKAIMQATNHPNAKVCWNCNSQDLDGEGIEANFAMVSPYFGDTVHVRELNVGDYPFQQLIDMLVAMDYEGWVLLECRTEPKDLIRALHQQRELFEQMLARARSAAERS